MWDPLRPKYLQKRQKPKYLAEKKRKRRKDIRKRLGRGTLNTCAKFQGLPPKNGVDVGLWRNLGFYAWTSLCIVREFEQFFRLPHEHFPPLAQRIHKRSISIHAHYTVHDRYLALSKVHAQRPRATKPKLRKGRNLNWTRRDKSLISRSGKTTQLSARK